MRCIKIDLRNHRPVDKAELQWTLKDEFEHKRRIAHPDRERAARRAQARAVAEARSKVAEERRYFRDQRKRRQQVEENRRARRRLIRNVLAHLPEADHGIVLPDTSAALESCWRGFQAGILERSPIGAAQAWLRWTVFELVLDPRDQHAEADVVLKGIGTELWVRLDGLTDTAADAPRAPPRSAEQGAIAAEVIIDARFIMRATGAVDEAFVRSELCENLRRRNWRRLPFPPGG